MTRLIMTMTRFIVAVTVLLVVVGVLLATTGVLHFRSTKDETGLTIDKKELKEKTQEAVETTGRVGSRILDKTGETLRKAADRLRGSSSDRSTPAKTPAADDETARPPAGSKLSPEKASETGAPTRI